ncbi:MAG: DUF424 domain-containing protein [Thermoplasmatota archaeon]
MTISYRIYQQGDEVLLAACDKELLGKTFKEGDIHLQVKESFYGGDEIDRKELSKQFSDTTIANLVGEKTVDTALDQGFGFKENVLWVDNIPHLQIVRM